MKNEEGTKTAENTNVSKGGASGCCGGPAAEDSNACCVLDAELKAKGNSGCGCGTKVASPMAKGCC